MTDIKMSQDFFLLNFKKTWPTGGTVRWWEAPGQGRELSHYHGALCPSSLSALFPAPTFPSYRNLGGRSRARAMPFPGQGLGDRRSKATRTAARPPGPQHTSLLLQVHLVRARKLHPKQRLLCLHRSSASLPGFASYFKVIAPSGRLKSKFKGRR